MGAEHSSHRSHHAHKPDSKHRPSAVDDSSKSVAERRFKANFPEGYMTKEKFVEFYKLMNMSSIPDEECEHLFHIADVNNDGRVTYDEYKLFCDILSSGSVVDRLRLTFKLYDKDNSKGIAKEEIVRMLKVIYLFSDRRRSYVSVVVRLKCWRSYACSRAMEFYYMFTYFFRFHERL